MPLNPSLPGALMLVLLGCGASPLGDGPSASEPRGRGPTEVVRAKDLRTTAAIRASLSGPEQPSGGQLLTLQARIERRKPFQVPVEVTLVLPEGVPLIEGDPVISLPANTQADTMSLRYVIRADVLPQSDVKLVVHARGPSFGFHSEQPYRFGRSAPLPQGVAKDGVQVRVGEKSFGRSVDITPH